MQHLRRRHPRHQGPHRIGQVVVLRIDRDGHALHPLPFRLHNRSVGTDDYPGGSPRWRGPARRAAVAVVDGLLQVAPHGVGGVPGDVRGQHDVVQARAADCRRVSARRRRRRGPRRPAVPAQRVDQRVLVDDRRRARCSPAPRRASSRPAQRRPAGSRSPSVSGRCSETMSLAASRSGSGRQPGWPSSRCWCAGRRRPSRPRSARRAWRCCRSRPVPRCSRRCRAPSRRGSGPTASRVPARVARSSSGSRRSAASISSTVPSATDGGVGAGHVGHRDAEARSRRRRRWC